jgi:hypothetical protein
MKRIAVAALIISAVLAVSSCQEYFSDISPGDKGKEPQTENENNNGEGENTGGNGLELVLEW